MAILTNRTSKLKRLTALEIFELSRINYRAAKIEADKIKTVSFEESLELLDALVSSPATLKQRGILKSLILKINAKAVSENFSDLINIVRANPSSQGVVMALFDKLKFVNYEQAMSAAKLAAQAENLSLTYFFQSVALKCRPQELAENIFDVLFYLSEEPRASLVAQAMLLNLPARYLPKYAKLANLLQNYNFEPVFKIKLKLLRKKQLGDKVFMARSYKKAFTANAKIKLGRQTTFSPEAEARGTFNFATKDVLKTPFGRAVCAGFRYGQPLLVLPGDYHATFFDDLAPANYRKCGFKKIGRL